jgi:hypothetical protein
LTCSYLFFCIKSTTFAFLHDLFPRRQICEKKCLQISILQVILPRNIVKDSTKSAQPNVFLFPSQRGGAQPEAESCMRGVALEDASCLSLFLNELSGLAKRKPAVSCTGILQLEQIFTNIGRGRTDLCFCTEVVRRLNPVKSTFRKSARVLTVFAEMDIH